jgi:hypothetical protein
MLVLVLLRPAWCPPLLCPSPQLIRIPSFHSRGIHDSSLELYLIQLQSEAYMIPGDPAHYTEDTLPKSIGVLQADGQNSTGHYHLILGLQSLLRGTYGLTIQSIGLIVKDVSDIPSPLNIWYDHSFISYEKEIQGRAFYFGQERGGFMPAVFASPQGDYSGLQTRLVHLNPAGADQIGETEQIDLHIVSQVKADVQFFVQVTYRIDNESVSHTMRLPSLFEVVFADPSDWHLYQFLNGHFVAES